MVEFQFLSIPIDSGLTDCGAETRNWTPEQINTVGDLMGLLASSRAGLQECWDHNRQIREGLKEAPPTPVPKGADAP